MCNPQQGRSGSILCSILTFFSNCLCPILHRCTCVRWSQRRRWEIGEFDTFICLACTKFLASAAASPRHWFADLKFRQFVNNGNENEGLRKTSSDTYSPSCRFARAEFHSSAIASPIHTFVDWKSRRFVEQWRWRLENSLINYDHIFTFMWILLY